MSPRWGRRSSIVDYDRDGWPDIYVDQQRRGEQESISITTWGNGKFEDVAEKLGIADVNKARYRRLDWERSGAITDNDGYEDLLLYKWAARKLVPQTKRGKGFTCVNRNGGASEVGSTPNSAILGGLRS